MNETDTETHETFGEYFSESFGHTILCQGCGSDNLHHISVDVCYRDEDAKTGVHSNTNEHRVLVDNSMEENPSARRDGIRILARCELCEKLTYINICQHKGTTYINTTLCQDKIYKTVLSKKNN
jgi:hypothetical protein